MQRVHDEERTIDETITVLDGDTALVPRGYHAVFGPPGYDLYYLSTSWQDLCASGRSRTTPVTSGYSVDSSETKKEEGFHQDLFCERMPQGIAA